MVFGLNAAKSHMDRRALLRQTGAAGITIVGAGCLGLDLESDGASRAPPIVEERPDGVYLPSHVEGMNLAGEPTKSGDYKAALTYSYPHRFWNVNGESVQRTGISEDDDAHLMAVVWDPETGEVLPETGLSIEILQEGELVSQEVIYPMLSQPMGFHYGANFSLAGDGTYTGRLSIGAVRTRRTGSFRERFGTPTTMEVEFEFTERALNRIPFELLENAGSAGAVEPMEMGALPSGQAPEKAGLPGTVLGEATTNDAVLVAVLLENPPVGVEGDGAYLAVSARTPYNRMLIPAMELEARLDRTEGESVETELVRTLDPELSYHYGAIIDSVEPGDQLELLPTVQPQVARHEGFETAFGGLKGGMDSASIEV